MAADDRPQVDNDARDSLRKRGQLLVQQARAGAPNPSAKDQELRRKRDQLDDDQCPVNELRRVAEEVAAEAVYKLTEWDSLSLSFALSGSWDGSLHDVRTTLNKINLKDLASRTIADAGKKLANALAGWSTNYLDHEATSRADGADSSWQSAAEPEGGKADEVDKAAKRFADLAGRLLRKLADDRAPGPSGHLTTQLSFRQIARTREELALFLERIIIAVLDRTVKQAREATRSELTRRLHQAPVGQAQLSQWLETADEELRKLETAGPGSEG